MEERKKKIFKILLIVLGSILGFVLLLIGGIYGYRTWYDSYYYGYSGVDKSMQYPESDAYFPSASRLESSAYDIGSYTDVDTSSVGIDIIKTGTISISVDDIDTTVETIEGVLNKYDSNISYMNDYGKGKDRSVQLTIKVEVSQFLNMFNELKELEGEFENSSISEEDVTDTVVDLEARLTNYRNEESQLLEILQTAVTVEDVLAVHAELSSVRAEIEYLEGTLDSIKDMTDYSTISVTISQSSTGSALNDDEWKPFGVVKDAARALLSFGKGVVNVLIYVLVFSPAIALVVVPIVLVRRKRQKKV